MTFLKKLGLVVAKIAGIVAAFGPGLQYAVPNSGAVVGRVLDLSQQLTSVITTVEAIGQAASTVMPGAEKLRVASPLVAQAILQSAAIAGKNIAKPELFDQGCTKVADGWADILNSIDEDDVETQSL